MVGLSHVRRIRDYNIALQFGLFEPQIYMTDILQVTGGTVYVYFIFTDMNTCSLM